MVHLRVTLLRVPLSVSLLYRYHCPCHYCTGLLTLLHHCTGPLTTATLQYRAINHCDAAVPDHYPYTPLYRTTTRTPLYRHHCRAYLSEVYTVLGIGVTASMGSFMKKNAESSGFDLADLIKNSPRWKYRKWSRPTMNFRVRTGLLTDC